MNIQVNNHCKDIAKLLQKSSYDDIYYESLQKNYIEVVKYLLDNGLVNPLLGETQKGFTFYPTKNKHLEVIKLLLTYPEVKDDQEQLLDILVFAIRDNYDDIFYYMLNNFFYSSNDLSIALENTTNINYIKKLVNEGADPNVLIYEASKTNNFKLLQFLLTYDNINVTIESIMVALGLRYYDILKLLILNWKDIDIILKNKLISLLDNNQSSFEMIEKLLLPYITNQGWYYEIRNKWHIKNF